tara:strand:+ start:26 stop:202 length:177 start_codon:yes stop_codon:yes gene_type:complete
MTMTKSKRTLKSFGKYVNLRVKKSLKIYLKLAKVFPCWNIVRKSIPVAIVKILNTVLS